MCYTHFMTNLSTTVNRAKAVCLCLEASADSASACIFIDGECRSEAVNYARHGHSETLVGLIEQVIADCGISATQIDMIIAGCGPGSFTGLRVCLATAHGYQLATNAQPVGISATLALAADSLANQDKKSDVILSYCDSRRHSLFVQLFDSELRALSEIEDIPCDKFSQFLDGWKTQANSITLAGDSRLLPHPKEGYSDGITSHNVVMTAKLLGAVIVAEAGYLDSYPHYNLPLMPLYIHPAYVTAPSAQT